MKEQTFESKVIVFVGAGASAGLGMPTTPQFIDVLKQKIPDTNMILEAYRQYCKSKYAENRVQPTLDSEYIRDWLLQLKRAAESIQMLPSIASEPKVPQPQSAAKFVENIITSFDKTIRDSYGEIESDKAYAHYLPLLEVLHSNRLGVIPIFTTNYDLVFESMLDCERCDWDIVTGWRSTGRRKILDTKIYDNNNNKSNRLLVFKLHGSTDWWMNEKGVIEQVPIDYKAPPNYSEVMIYPTREKFDKIKEKPFSFYYKRFEDYLSSRFTRICIAIGYSFRDKFINEMFLEALKNGIKLLVFDKAMKKNQLFVDEARANNLDSSIIEEQIDIYSIDFGNWQHRPEIRNSFKDYINSRVQSIQ